MTLVSKLDKSYSDYDNNLTSLWNLIQKAVPDSTQGADKTRAARDAYYNRVYKTDLLVKGQSDIINVIVNNFIPKKKLLEMKKVIENFVSKDIITGTNKSHSINYLDKFLINVIKLQDISKTEELINRYIASLEQIFVINNDIKDNEFKIDFNNTIDINKTKSTLQEYKTYLKNYNDYKDPVTTSNGIQKLINLQQIITDKNISSSVYIKHLEDFLYKDRDHGLIK